MTFNFKTRIDPKTGRVETYCDDTTDAQAAADKLARDKRELRDMLDGNLPFHDDPNVERVPVPEVVEGGEDWGVCFGDPCAAWWEAEMAHLRQQVSRQSIRVWFDEARGIDKTAVMFFARRAGKSWFRNLYLTVNPPVIVDPDRQGFRYLRSNGLSSEAMGALEALYGKSDA